MDYKYIEQLLERYWACETSLEEESILRSFFAQKDVPVSLLPYRDLFLQEQKLGEAKLGEEFDERILEMVGEEAEEPVKARRLRPIYLLRPFLKAAACIAVLLTFTMAIQQAVNKDQGDKNMARQQAKQPAPAVIVDVETAYDQNTKDAIDSTKAPQTLNNELKEIPNETADK